MNGEEKILSMLEAMKEENAKQFDSIDKRFVAIERTLGEHTKSLNAISADIKRLDNKFNMLTSSVLSLDKKFDELKRAEFV